MYCFVYLQKSSTKEFTHDYNICEDLVEREGGAQCFNPKNKGYLTYEANLEICFRPSLGNLIDGCKISL